MAVFEYDRGGSSGDDERRFVSVTDQGGSKRITIPAEMAADLGIEFGDQVAVKTEDGKAVVTPL